MRLVFKIVIFMMCAANAVSLSAQKQNGKVEALRVSFISKRLDLSATESDKFWPVYNEYNDKLRLVRKNLRDAYKSRSATITNAEAEDLYKLELQSREAELDIHKLYQEKIKALIGVRKLVLLRIAEEDFKRELINTIKDKNE